MVVTSADPLVCTWISSGRYAERAFEADAIVSLAAWMNRAIDAEAARRQAAIEAQRREVEREREMRRAERQTQKSPRR